MSFSFVIAGGSTVAEYDTRQLHQLGHVIGVNDSMLWANVHTGVTMDRLWFENRWPYVAARRVEEVHVRQKCDCNVPKHYAKTFTHTFEPVLSSTEGALVGSNSGTCAINLAYQRMDDGDMLFLLGFDMCNHPDGRPYWYPPYPWASPSGGTKDGKLKEWAQEFGYIASQFKAHGINVFNVTHRSRIEAFPKITFAQMMEMVR